MSLFESILEVRPAVDAKVYSTSITINRNAFFELITTQVKAQNQELKKVNLSERILEGLAHKKEFLGVQVSGTKCVEDLKLVSNLFVNKLSLSKILEEFIIKKYSRKLTLNQIKWVFNGEEGGRLVEVICLITFSDNCGLTLDLGKLV